MADGYARALNDPSVAGVCIAQNGPGITNFVTGNNDFLTSRFHNDYLAIRNITQDSYYLISNL